MKKKRSEIIALLDFRLAQRAHTHKFGPLLTHFTIKISFISERASAGSREVHCACRRIMHFVCHFWRWHAPSAKLMLPAGIVVDSPATIHRLPATAKM